MPMPYCDFTFKEATRIVDSLEEKFPGVYSGKVDEIYSLINDEIHNGDAETFSTFNNASVPDLRLININHYDQHMEEDDEDTPKWEDVLVEDSSVYVFAA